MAARLTQPPDVSHMYPGERAVCVRTWKARMLAEVGSRLCINPYTGELQLGMLWFALRDRI